MKYAKDNDTLEVPFFTKSKEVFPLTGEHLKILEMYQYNLDKGMITMAPKWQLKKQLLFEESRRVVKFLSEFENNALKP